ncbi:MAG: alpha/beta hydrolase [Erysipelotrichaceae bacterium]|nr:alpha/beta hydrolase [Erysipelotrichaceae bacterium]
MALAIIIVIIILACTWAAGYYVFASVFVYKDKEKAPLDPAFIDSENDMMRPTARRLYAYIEPLKEEMKKLPLKRLETMSFDGNKLVAYLLEGNPKEVVICVHGYKSDIYSDFADKIKIYQDRGTTVLLVNDRAHGESEGKYLGFSEHDRMDVARWVDKINTMYEKPRIYLHGVSMGGATVIHCANMELENVCGIIDDCGFDSILGISQSLMKNIYHVPYFPLGYVAWFWAQVLNKVNFNKSIGETCAYESDVPIVFIHGKEDHYVPCQMSIDMYEQCQQPKELHLIDDCGHAAAYMVATKEYTDMVNRLMNGEVK